MPIHIWEFILFEDRYNTFEMKNIKKTHKLLCGISGLSIITDQPSRLIPSGSSFNEYETEQ